jgi:hypothetical protein
MVVLTTNTAVPVSWSIAFSVGITMEKVCVFAAGRFEPPTIGHKAMIDLIIKTAVDPENAYIVVSTAGDPKPGDTPFPNAEEKLKNPLTSAEKIRYLREMYPGVNFVSAAEAGGGGPLGAWNYVKKNAEEHTKFVLVAGTDRKADFDPAVASTIATSHMWDKPLGLVKWTAEEGVKRGQPGYTPTPEQAARFIKANTDKVKRQRDPSIPRFVENPRGATAVSGTSARKLAVDGNFEGFKKAVKVGGISDDSIQEMYDRIRSVHAEFKDAAAAQQTAREERAAAANKKKGGADIEEEDLSTFDADDEPPTAGARRRRRTYRRCRKCGLPKKPDAE